MALWGLLSLLKQYRGFSLVMRERETERTVHYFPSKCTKSTVPNSEAVMFFTSKSACFKKIQSCDYTARRQLVSLSLTASPMLRFNAWTSALSSSRISIAVGVLIFWGERLGDSSYKSNKRRIDWQGAWKACFVFQLCPRDAKKHTRTHTQTTTTKPGEYYCQNILHASLSKATVWVDLVT